MKFQIVIDCDTDHSAFWFMDARAATRDILGAVTDEAESVIVMKTGRYPIKVTGSRIISVNKEFEYVS